MANEKTSLVDMAEACKHEAWGWEGHIARWERDHPNDPLPPGHHWRKMAATYGSAAKTLAIMASYEDRSREFIAQLLKDYAEGRWP